MNHLTTLLIPNAAYHEDVLSDLMDVPVFVTEFLWGRNWEATIFRGLGHDTHRIETSDEGLLYDTRLDYPMEQALSMAPSGVDSITFRGTVLDPSAFLSSVYGMVMPEIRLFYVEINGEPVSPEMTFRLFNAFGLRVVPVLEAGQRTLYEWLARRSPQDAAKGQSRLAAVPRAGVIIRPVREITHVSIGRVILKLTPEE